MEKNSWIVYQIHLTLQGGPINWLFPVNLHWLIFNWLFTFNEADSWAGDLPKRKANINITKQSCIIEF